MQQITVSEVRSWVVGLERWRTKGAGSNLREIGGGDSRRDSRREAGIATEMIERAAIMDDGPVETLAVESR